MASPLLSNVARAFDALTTTPVSLSYFPYIYAPTLHAARVSTAFQYNSRPTRARQSWGTYIAGYLIMAWGGSVISHLILSLPPLQLYSIQPYINYLAVHFFLTAFFTVFPSALNPRFLDTLLFPLDAALRVNSIASTMAMLAPGSSLPINPRLAASPFTHCILGAVASAGGGQSASAVGAWSDSWSLSAPGFLRSNPKLGTEGWVSGVLDKLDVWAGALIAIIYDVLTAHPALSSLSSVRAVLDFVGMGKTHVLSPLGAKAVCTIILSGLFGLRVYWVHWREVDVKTTASKRGRKTKVQ